MLLNIDKARRIGKLHADQCIGVPLPVGTFYRPFGKLGRDGGWFLVQSADEADAVLLREFPRAKLIRCPRCLGRLNSSDSDLGVPSITDPLGL